MSISTEKIKELRDITSAGIMDCRNALIKTDGDMEKAAEILKEQSLVRIEKKSQRQASQGLVEAYVHTGGRIGAMVEVNCETDFVARTPEFQELVHNIAMQVAAQEPICITGEQIPARKLFDLGLVNEVVEKEQLDDAVNSFVEKQLLPKSASSIQIAHQGSRMFLAQQYENFIGRLEKLYLEDLMSTKDAVEGINAFLEKRDPKWLDE